MSTPERRDDWLRWRPPGKLGVYAPWPLVGVTLLLVALIVFTPELESNGHQPGPGILTQAELVVDKLPTNGSLHFYVWALGETIRYDQISLGVATSFSWDGLTPVNWTTVTWETWDNQSNVLAVLFNAPANPVALNISAHYVSPSGSTWYVGVFAFFIAGAPFPGTESLYSTSDTSGVVVPSPITVSNTTLPFDVVLRNAGPTGGP